MHKLISKLNLLTLTLLTVVTVSSSTALAARPTAQAKTPPVLLGNDISWPQCNQILPGGQAFGIVGVNNGLANNTNPCLARELSWASSSKGGTGQPLAAVYVNTANPELAGSWWPQSNDYGGATVNNPYGTCAGQDDAACAYIYGYAKAYDDVNSRGVPAPASYLWWLDVETSNSWSSTNKVANTADLEGMTTYFTSVGARVGIYSTGYQWNQIAGTTASSSPLANLQSWVAGASSATDAKAKCSTAAPLTPNSPVTAVQFVQNRLDYDYSCI